MMDRFSRWIALVPLRTVTSYDIAKAMYKHWICNYGIPAVIITDQGSNFDSEVFHEVCNQLGIEKRRTTSYHPQTNGIIERMHRTLKKIVALKLHQFDDWEAALPVAQFALNTAINDAGVSPAMVLFGEQLPMPTMMFDKPIIDATTDPILRSFVQALSHNMRNMRKCLLKVDATIRPDPNANHDLKFKFEMVYVKVPMRTRAFMPKYVGPAMVLGSRGKVLTIKWLNGKIETVNVERCKPVHKLRDEFADVRLPVPHRLSSLIASECDEVLSEHSIDMFSYSSDSFSIVHTDGSSSLVVPDKLSKDLHKKAVTVCFHRSPGMDFPRRSQRKLAESAKPCDKEPSNPSVGEIPASVSVSGTPTKVGYRVWKQKKKVSEERLLREDAQFLSDSEEFTFD